MQLERRVLVVIGGGIAAYKALETIRLLGRLGVRTRAVLTRAATEFVTPLSVGALTGDKVFMPLFDLTDEAEMGHIELSRDADLILVLPATADLLAKMAHGLADDLASTVLLATDAPVMVAPAMNVRMWEHPATRANLALLQQRGVRVAGPVEGEMACGEYGYGRLAEPADIVAAVETFLQLYPRKPETPWDGVQRPLGGRRALVTSGPTHEPLDPVRYLANRSSGRQGHAIAGALAGYGADVTLVSGPTQLPPPLGIATVAVETAAQMRDACLAALPCDVAVFAAAVADWRPDRVAQQKIKKTGGAPDPIAVALNPDILAEIAERVTDRPPLVIGFAAETADLTANATAKRNAKKCDWIVANDVAADSGTFGGTRNTVTLITDDGADHWPAMDKSGVAARLVHRIADHFARTPPASGPASGLGADAA
ncbi:MAG: bifunctional phosphopantothenoylcysteine decarboxylase/phosphopantothenate--cysteine ligase CoaBC [Alphaproteobacteria bacterium]